MAKKIDPKVKKSIDEMSDSTKDFKNLAEDMFNSLKAGGATSKAVFKELGKMFAGLTDSSSNAVKSIKGIGASSKLAANSIEDMSDQQERFAEIQKILAGYDGPRLKASGLISKDLANQLSYNELIRKSKLNLSDLDTNQTIIEKKLTRIAEQRLKSQSDLNAAQLFYERANSKLDKLKTDELEKHKQVVKLQEKLNQGLSQYKLTVSQDTDVPYSNVIGFLIPIADVKMFIKNAISGGGAEEQAPPAEEPQV